MSRRSLLIASLIVAAGVLAGLFFMRRPPERVAAPAAKPSATAAVIAAAPRPTSTVARRVVRTETSFEPIDETKITAKQAEAAAARYRKAARFPRTSRPLEDGLDPIATSRAPDVDHEGKGTHGEPRLLAYPSLTVFEAPGDVVLYAEVVELHEIERKPDERKPERPRLQQVRVKASGVRGVISTADGVPITSVVFRDDGTHGDAAADDLLWTATYTPDPDKPGDFKGELQAQVVAQPYRGDELASTLTFRYTHQTAHLTGEYRESIVDGNLVIEAGVAVDEPGRFRLEGTLVTASDAKMIGYGYGEANLPAGNGWIPITYWGLLFHEMKADGPYQVFSLVLSSIAGDVVQEGDVVPSPYTTKAYTVSDFADRPFNDPEYTAKAEHYEALARQKQAAGQ
jgi:hypothetical protein